MSIEEFLEEWNNSSDMVLVHTSGSTGQPKPMYVEKRRMEASARMTCDFLGLHEGDTALLCMSLDYIAGKMMVVRALTCGLRLVVQEPSGKPELPPPSTLHPSPSTLDLVAMVPLQVWNLLHDAGGRERLKQVRHLIIGGGAIDEAMERELQDFPNAVWSTYGMTETLSHIAMRRLNGPERSEYYTPLPGVTLSQNEDGCLVIDAPAVHEGLLVTNDIVEFHSPSTPHLPPSTFKILGRKDNVICSGGIKIQIEEVERLLRPFLRVPYIISKAPDQRLGEQVVLLIEGTKEQELESIMDVCRKVLPKYWVPRHIVTVDHLPMTETGKPARAEAARMLYPSR